ncbi:olfactory receptor class A-like protein 1 [Lissotriton helveticus]
MEFYNIVQGTLYFSVTFTGIVGNILILLFISLAAYQEGKHTTSEVIFSQLAAANVIVYLTRTLPAALFKFGLKNFFDDASCKITALAFRTSRGMSIGLTCLLSCFQCAILSGTKRNVSEKQKIHRCVHPVTAILYVINIAANIDSAVFATNPYNLTDMKYVYNPGFCIVVYPGKMAFEGKGYATVTMDLFLVIVMALASCQILLILYKHRKKMQGVRSSSQSQTGAESQAAQSVVLLVFCYTIFFGIDNALRLYQTASNEIITMLSDIRLFFTMCYGSAFPIILFICNNKIKNIAVYLLFGKNQNS